MIWFPPFALVASIGGLLVILDQKRRRSIWRALPTKAADRAANQKVKEDGAAIYRGPVPIPGLANRRFTQDYG